MPSNWKRFKLYQPSQCRAPVQPHVQSQMLLADTQRCPQRPFLCLDSFKSLDEAVLLAFFSHTRLSDGVLAADSVPATLVHFQLSESKSVSRSKECATSYKPPLKRTFQGSVPKATARPSLAAKSSVYC